MSPLLSVISIPIKSNIVIKKVIISIVLVS